MSDLIQAVKDGAVQETTSKTGTSSSSSKNELGKDAFLELLVTQMKYQDPLNPNTDTEYIAQLATFSQLEQLQNLSSTTNNTQAFSLVGKTVMLKTETSLGNTSYITGKVDFVAMSGKKTQISVEGKLYDFDQLDTVLSEEYVTEQGLPKVPEAAALQYDADNPKDLNFNVNLGSGDTVASDVRVAIGEAVIDSSLVKLTGNKVTIDDKAFANLINGTYKLTVAFNDPKFTTIKDKVTVQIKNSEVTATTETTDTAQKTDTTTKTTT
jgi:flagellar basal-body rod modification protein FlgD